jgi:type VI secretion system secreted protein Hcp
MADVIHLSLAGIKGESTHPRHKDEIALESWSWGVDAANPLASGSVGKPTFQSLSFAHRVDAASPLLWRACVIAQAIPEGVLTVARPMASAGDYLMLRLTGIVIAGISLSDAAADTQPPYEAVILNFATFEYTYRPQLANGSFGAAVTLKYDLRTNRVF